MTARLLILIFAVGILVSCKKDSFPTTVTDIDGNIYKTVKIGDQLWIAENLKTSTYNDGTPIPTNLTYSEWQTARSGTFGKNEVVPDVYGYYYNWYAVQTGKLCPKNWHIPTIVEWQTLSSFLGGDAESGGKLKSTSSLWAAPNTGASNSSGFNALPAGFHMAGVTTNFGTETSFWSTTQVFYDFSAYIGSLNNYYKEFYSINSAKFWLGLSCRCLKD